MIDVGELKHGFVPGQKSLLWDHGTLKDVLEERFGLPTATPFIVDEELRSLNFHSTTSLHLDRGA
jgi:hypothetical protein